MNSTLWKYGWGKFEKFSLVGEGGGAGGKFKIGNSAAVLKSWSN